MQRERKDSGRNQANWPAVVGRRLRSAGALWTYITLPQLRATARSRKHEEIQTK